MSARLSGYPDRLVATPWLALLGFLAVSQTAHLLEHVAQMVQIHVLHLSGANAQGIVGQLNIEWVHFIWNALVLIALLALVPHFRSNPWLIAVAPLAAWHFVEHSVMIATYIQTGVSGSPGLLSSGGLIFGGLPIARPDLHFLYNLVETGPLLMAWLVEIRKT
ncbi:MAG TPA: hypothetical protein VFA31_03440 [Candidatus Polarisedimenticolia bacterium]|jgi:hypothetical protein|nr:hypothetical protein [Candidatus Polarisedimenticolia bacterium]